VPGRANQGSVHGALGLGTRDLAPSLSTRLAGPGNAAGQRGVREDPGSLQGSSSCAGSHQGGTSIKQRRAIGRVAGRARANVPEVASLNNLAVNETRW
jgi:hypothetical protein